ncbi:MAG TPA: DUF6073 family protein [Thermoanaerobaculia bacterium]|nr:DUF6073 family protein [Thermoanaerobaculia bacterium]
MSEFELFGRQLRQLLQGFLNDAETSRLRRSAQGWGRRIDTRQLKDLYGPMKVGKFEIAPSGIDNLGLTSEDTFFVPGKGTFTVSFNGFFRVARENPRSTKWEEADVPVNMVEMGLRGDSELGPIQVSLNQDFVSAGQTFAPGRAAAAACRIATAAEFALPQAGMTLFNKEPILLMNDAIESIPPVEDPNGEAHIYRLPLFDRSNPDGEPAAYLMRLRYTVGNYMPQEEIEALRSRTQLR